MGKCACNIPRNILKCLDELGFHQCIEHINAIRIKCKAPLDIVVIKHGYEDEEFKFGYFECKSRNLVCQFLSEKQRDDFIEWVEIGKEMIL